jgi:hypothetical protein
MTIDERIEKLTERHETLTQSVELMAAENRDRDAKLGKLFGQIAESLQRLAKIAEDHERRITGLEGGTPA